MSCTWVRACEDHEHRYLVDFAARTAELRLSRERVSSSTFNGGQVLNGLQVVQRVLVPTEAGHHHRLVVIQAYLHAGDNQSAHMLHSRLHYSTYSQRSVWRGGGLVLPHLRRRHRRADALEN